MRASLQLWAYEYPLPVVAALLLLDAVIVGGGEVSIMRPSDELDVTAGGEGGGLVSIKRPPDEVEVVPGVEGGGLVSIMRTSDELDEGGTDVSIKRLEGTELAADALGVPETAKARGVPVPVPVPVPLRFERLVAAEARLAHARTRCATLPIFVSSAPRRRSSEVLPTRKTGTGRCGDVKHS